IVSGKMAPGRRPHVVGLAASSHPTLLEQAASPVHSFLGKLPFKLPRWVSENPLAQIASPSFGIDNEAINVGNHDTATGHGKNPVDYKMRRRLPIALVHRPLLIINDFKCTSAEVNIPVEWLVLKRLANKSNNRSAAGRANHYIAHYFIVRQIELNGLKRN